MDEARAERARRRKAWPGHVGVRHEPAQCLTARERVASMHQLALDAMALRGEPLPIYERSTMPGRVIVRG